eukprot:CAMPEP_0119062868 /NCGR_PEP_ID=MMETSP1178-20130426/6358_1 /TAXON_ID=33656 /ORGANISM="unid sp, Strain CCMP2000" /LENGTH=65 /DNA_ID=CAMNT_0007044177 /DNA_START=212 /DNA_END=410 /DNA_ORIENTATION=+
MKQKKKVTHLTDAEASASGSSIHVQGHGGKCGVIVANGATKSSVKSYPKGREDRAEAAAGLTPKV